MYGYAYAAAQHFVRWMAYNEQPYFDAQHELEYPTETWPAQDMRKANVLRIGGALLSGADRDSALRRGLEIADRAWTDLFSFEKPHTTRALAILLTEGLRDAFCREGQELDLPKPNVTDGFGEPVEFIPQRQRIKNKLRTPLGALHLAVKVLYPGNWPAIWRAYRLLR